MFAHICFTGRMKSQIPRMWKCSAKIRMLATICPSCCQLLDGDRTSHPNMVRIPDVHNISHILAPAAYYNGNCTHIHPWVSYIYEIQLHTRTSLIAQLVEHLSMNAGGLRFNPWCGHFYTLIPACQDPLLFKCYEALPTLPCDIFIYNIFKYSLLFFKSPLWG